MLAWLLGVTLESRVTGQVQGLLNIVGQSTSGQIVAAMPHYEAPQARRLFHMGHASSSSGIASPLAGEWPTNCSGQIGLEAQRGGVAQGPVRLGGTTFVARAVMEGTASCKEEVHKSVGTKVQIGEVQLLDVAQCATVWKALARM